MLTIHSVPTHACPHTIIVYRLTIHPVPTHAYPYTLLYIIYSRFTVTNRRDLAPDPIRPFGPEKLLLQRDGSRRRGRGCSRATSCQLQRRYYLYCLYGRSRPARIR